MRLWLFRTITLLLPVFLLLLVELVLRMFQLGQSTPLLISNPANPAYWVTEPQIINRYFTDEKRRPNVQLEPGFVLKQKPEQSLRLVVQGGSSAAGYPYGAGASLAGMLEQRLRRTFPDKKIEVLNTALSAVNSYTLLDFSDEILSLEPDAVLIYAGHNEYLGLLGVGSSYIAGQSVQATRLMLWLRQLYLFQAIESLYSALSPEPQPTESNRTLMAKVARHKQIPLNSPLYQAGLEQFNANMSELLRKYQDAGVQVFIATVASNIADQPPFESTAIAEPLLATLQQAEQALQQADTQAATQLAEQLSKAASDSASFHFRLGQLFRGLKQQPKALAHLQQARDLDQLRFRAPSAMNDAIRLLARQHSAILVDTEQALASQSTQGLIGKELMLEHLHPNVRGYFLLADSFYQQLAKQSFSGKWPVVIPTEFSWQERPILPAEEYAGQLKVMQLVSDYPFQPAPVPVEFPKAQTAEQRWAQRYVEGSLDWLSMIQQSANLYHQKKDGDMLLKSLKILADALPHDGEVNLQAAQILLQAGRKGEARFYVERSLMTTKPPAQAQMLKQHLSPGR